MRAWKRLGATPSPSWGRSARRSILVSLQAHQNRWHGMPTGTPSTRTVTLSNALSDEGATLPPHDPPPFSPPFALGRLASHSCISSSVQTLVFGPSWFPAGNPWVCTQRFKVGQFLIIPRALRSANLSSTDMQSYPFLPLPPHSGNESTRSLYVKARKVMCGKKRYPRRATTLSAAGLRMDLIRLASAFSACAFSSRYECLS